MKNVYAPVDHPGVEVPEHLRHWEVDHPDYAPVDITPVELRAQSLLCDVDTWITDPVPAPTQITNWRERQAAALVPFLLDSEGWPLNPTGRTGRSGRNLGSWGENQAADPVVVAGTGSERRILLILRSDVRQWALPGGMVDPGETAPAAVVRELQEETGVDLTDRSPEILRRDYVADWRATDHAWITSTAALYTLPDVLPAVAADDAADAVWVRFESVEQLAVDLAPMGGLYEAHRPILTVAAERLG